MLILIEDLGMQYPKNTSKLKRRFGIYKCFCGNKFEAQIQNVNRKHTKSCGCIKGYIKHNMSSDKIYNVWIGMKQRCYNKNNKRYKDYGARGIFVCKEWLEDFMNFYNWSINNGYKEGLSIDRADNDKGYNPSNCRWTDCFIQNTNQRKIKNNNTSGYRGVSFDKRLNKWISQIQYNNIHKHIGLFKNKIDAAMAYDKFVIDNKLNHTRNFI